MKTQRINLERILISPAIAERLLACGIKKKAAFFFFKMDWQGSDGEMVISYEVANEETVESFIDENNNPLIPAWSMEELAVMIGGDWGKPDIPESKKATMIKIGDKEESVRRMEVFEVMYPESMKQYEKGADAFGEYLEALLLSNKIKVKSVNDRLDKFFKEEE